MQVGGIYALLDMCGATFYMDNLRLLNQLLLSVYQPTSKLGILTVRLAVWAGNSVKNAKI